MEKLAPDTTKEMEEQQKQQQQQQQQQQNKETVKADRRGDDDKCYEGRRQRQTPQISEMKPTTREAYGGGMYAAEANSAPEVDRTRPRASETQSADGPEEPPPQPKHKPPPSTGDRDLDITGQSYIQ